MKTLIFLCGPNGIGKTTLGKALLSKINNSAYVDSDPLRYMNPPVLDDDTIPTVRKNISGLIQNYLDCPTVETVIFSYGFHGRRKEVFDGVMDDLSVNTYQFVPFLLTCGEEENIRRMQTDGRDEERIKRAVEVSRKAFNDVTYPQIDITNLTVDETADYILSIVKLR